MTCAVRFMSNNHFSTASLNVSSELAGYEVENAKNDRRSSYWVSSGYFNVTALNNQIYINDGADQVASVAIAEYTDRDALALAIETALNGVSTDWVVSFNGSTGYFTIDRTAGTKILRVSQSTNAIWDLIGYTGSLDIPAGIADAPRWHEYEYILVDMVIDRPADFFAMIGPSGLDFDLSLTASVTLQGNSINDWTAPPFEASLTVTNDGIFSFSDLNPSYRYYRIVIQDRENFLNSDGLAISHIYIGDYSTLTQTNIAKGFNYRTVDPSRVNETIGGQQYFDTRKKYGLYQALSIQNMTEGEKLALEAQFSDVGRSGVFYMSLDPEGIFSSDINTFTKLVRYSQDPAITHVFLDRFTLQFEAREVI